MEFVEQVIALFGYSSDTKELSDFLDAHNIRERPKFDPSEGAPQAIVSKDADGYYLRFSMRTDFEEDIGPTAGDPKSDYFVLQEIRLQGPQNLDKVETFKGKLPFGLNFSQTIDEVLGTLGKPDIAGDPGSQKRVMVWNNFKNLQLGILLSRDEKHLRHLSILPVRKKFRR